MQEICLILNLYLGVNKLSSLGINTLLLTPNTLLF